jgi:hypothetical protein
VEDRPLVRGRLLSLRRSALLVLGALASIWLSGEGCGGKKETVTGPLPGFLVYPPLTSPQNVMQAMVLAYVRRDSVETGLLYDPAYQGISIDRIQAPLDTLEFTRADEVAHVGALARNRDVTGISCELVPSLTRFRDTADPAGWASIQDPLGRITIEGVVTYDVDPAGLTMEFKFAPTTPDSASPTDTTWKIARWFEVRN